MGGARTNKPSRKNEKGRYALFTAFIFLFINHLATASFNIKLHIRSLGYYFQIIMMQVEVGYVGFKIDAVVLPNLISVTSVRKLFAEGKWQSLFELNGSTSRLT